MPKTKKRRRYEPYWLNSKVFEEEEARAALAKVNNEQLRADSYIGDALDTHNNNKVVERAVSPEVFLSQRVCGAVAWSRQIKEGDESDSPSELRDQFSDIANQCRKLQRDLEFRKFDGWESRNLWDWLPAKLTS